MNARAPFLAPARKFVCACLLAVAAFAVETQAHAGALPAPSPASSPAEPAEPAALVAASDVSAPAPAASSPSLGMQAPSLGAQAPSPDAPSPGAPASATAPEAAASAPGAPAPVIKPELVVDAPKALRTLLEEHLDIERALHLPNADTLDESEWARLIAATPAQARALAATQGYFRAEATVTPDPANPQRLVIRLVPGVPAKVSRLTFEFDGDIAQRAEDGDPGAVALQGQLRENWLLPPGSVFRNPEWGRAKTQVLTSLRTQGYAAALWTATSAQVDPETDEVSLFVIVDSGPRFRAGDIVVEGLEHQPERNVRLLAGFGPGVPLTSTRLQDYSDRLTKTGLFDQVAVTYDPDPQQADRATITVRVHEQSLQQATAAIGYSSTSKGRITLEHANRLIFGYPATLTNKIQWGSDIKQWDGALVTHPAESFHSWLVGASAGRIVSTDDVVRSAYVRLGRTQSSNPLDRMTFVQVERSKQCTPAWRPDEPSNDQWSCIDARAVSLNQQNVWRRIDSVVLPTDGYTLSAQAGAGYTGGPDTGYGPYLRLYGRVTGYWPLANEWFSQARLELGQIVVKRDVVIPDAEQWRAGGVGSVRGYEWRSLGATNQYDRVVGGNALITTSVEVAHVITQKIPSLWWATFIDAGHADNRFDDLKMALGYGLGIRWRSPVGPLSVDWSWGQEIHRGRIDLSVGIVF